MLSRKVWTLLVLLALATVTFLVFQAAVRASPLPQPPLTDDHAPPAEPHVPPVTFAEAQPPPSVAAPAAATPAGEMTAQLAPGPGTVLEVFTNTWSYSTVGFVYDPVRNTVRYAHESQSSTHNPTIYDVRGVRHTVLLSIALSTENAGWPWQIDNRTGAGYDSSTDTYFLPDYNGDLANADDNIVEIMPDGTILNAWELDDEVGSNDSSDGTEIGNVLDIAIVPGSPTRYFVTAAYDDNVVYEIALIKTGTLWTPNSWHTVATYTVPLLSDNLGIDYDEVSGYLYHSGWHTDTLVVTDLTMKRLGDFRCPGVGGFNSGVTVLEGSDPPEVWVTDFSSDQTTRCLAWGAAPTEIEWGKWIAGERWTPGFVHTAETSDTLKIVDVITAMRAVSLTDSWNPELLTLLDSVVEPPVGSMITTSNSVIWQLPPLPEIVAITKWFHVEPSTWMTASVSEILSPEDGEPEERVLTIEKLAPVLRLDADYAPEVLPGSIATYTLVYGNDGGYENAISIHSTFPANATFAHAIPYPDDVAPDGSFAEWHVGDLAQGSEGEILVFVAIPVEPGPAVGIQNDILNHMGQIEDDAPVEYTPLPPPAIEWGWHKIIDEAPWTPGMVVTTETSDTLQIVEVITHSSAVGAALIEEWDPEHLQLLTAEPGPGTSPPLPLSDRALMWEFPPGSEPYVLTKTFHVRPCTWPDTVLWEELLVASVGPEPEPVEARPVFIEKRPSQLWIGHDDVAHPEIYPGELVTYVLHYGNVGGFEDHAWMLNEFPPGAVFLEADPAPSEVSSDGHTAVWETLGSLANGDEGTITVTAEIVPGVLPSQTLFIFAGIFDHVDVLRGATEVPFHVAPPEWEKRVNGALWYDGMEITIGTGDDFHVVDTVAGPYTTRLVEAWDPARLELVEVGATCGEVITTPESIEWIAPRPTCPETVALEKSFRVRDCAWTYTFVHEELWVEDLPWQERPLLVHKPPADLWVTVPEDILGRAGQVIAYPVHFGNAGAPESSAFITATFPAEARFFESWPVPTDADPQGSWARWDIGVLESDQTGTIEIAVQLLPDLPPYTIVETQNYIYDHVPAERGWAPLRIVIRSNVYLPLVLRSH